MNKNIIIAGAVLLVLLFFGIIIAIKVSISDVPGEPLYFTEEPESWIEKDRSSRLPGDMAINIHKATKTLSFFEDNRQEYYYYGNRLSFFSHGYYKGSSFTIAYVEPSALEMMGDWLLEEQLDWVEKNTLVKISPNLNPENGVIEGFILAKAKGEEFEFFIYVDEDWKRKLEYTNIVWGNDFEDLTKVNIRSFDFSNSIDGIYVDSIIFDADWIKTRSPGGVFVGELTLDKISQKDLNATFMYVR
jgi:hypothetical protein